MQWLCTTQHPTYCASQDGQPHLHAEPTKGTAQRISRQRSAAKRTSVGVDPAGQATERTQRRRPGSARTHTHTRARAHTRTHAHRTHAHTRCALRCGHRQVQILSPSNGAIYTDTEVLGASAGSASARPSGSLARAGDDSPGWLCRARTARPAHRARSVTSGSTSATASSDCATPNRAGFRRLVCAPAAAHRELWCDRVCRRHS